MTTLSIVIAVIAVIAAIAFAVWFCCRTPDNLEAWYCIPVVIILVVLIVFLLMETVLPSPIL